MEKTTVDQIIQSPEFKSLIKARRKLSLPIIVTIIPAYFGFILMVAFSPETLGRSLGTSPVSIGIYAGLALLVLSFILTALYLKISNGKISQLQDELKRKFTQGNQQ